MADMGEQELGPGCPRGGPWVWGLGCSPGMASWLSFRSLSSSSLTRLDWARDVTAGVWGRQQGGVLAAGEFLHSSRNLRSQMMRVPAKSGACQPLLALATPAPEHLSPEQGVGPSAGPWLMDTSGSEATTSGFPQGSLGHQSCPAAIPHIIPPIQAPGALHDAAQGVEPARGYPWWPTWPPLCCLEARASPGAHSLLARQQQLPVVPCSRVEQQGLGIGLWAPWGPVPIVSARNLLLPARGQQLGSMGHLLLQPAGCAVSTQGALPPPHAPNCLPAMPEVTAARVPRLQPCHPLPIPGRSLPGSGSGCSPGFQGAQSSCWALQTFTQPTPATAPQHQAGLSPQRSLTEGTRWSQCPQGEHLWLHPNMASSGMRHMHP